VGEDQAMGWSSLVAPYIYTSYGVCMRDAKLLCIPGVQLRSLMTEHPTIGHTISQNVASIIRTRMIGATSMLTYFLSIVSHELKRPIAAVENYLQILLGGYAGELNPKQTRILNRSKLRLTDLRNLISDILDFVRLQPEQIRADFEWLDPAEIGAEAIEEVSLAASQKDIRFKAVGASEFLPLFAARRRLRQVISNLLANAVKFSLEGSTVVLSAHDRPDALVIEVTDEGIGIPEEDLDHIFDDFYRASNVGEVGGTGLGLSIAKKIVQAHDGQITVESPCSPDGVGTKFTVVIPRKTKPAGNLDAQGDRRDGASSLTEGGAT
jgi:signal transduction histidine kinase